MKRGDYNIIEQQVVHNALITLQNNVEDIRNIVQLLSMSLYNNEDDVHILRSTAVIDKMLETLVDVDVQRLKDMLITESDG